MRASIAHLVSKVFTSTVAEKREQLLAEVDEKEFSKVLARNPIVIDLISYVYPHQELTTKDLYRILLEQSDPVRVENIFVFRADRSLADKFRGQLSSSLKELRATNAIPQAGKLRCFFKVDHDVDQAALKRYLDEKVGVGMVTDEQIRNVARAWEDEEDR
jgi:hypothetical protein